VLPRGQKEPCVIKTVDADLNDPEQGLAIVRLLDEYARDLMGGGETLSDFCKTNLVRELSRRSNVHVVLAYENDQAIGLCICIEGFSTFACKPLLNIHDVAVSSNQRGKGISKLLMHHVESLALRLGCCKLTLEVLEKNTVAMNLYRSVGFQQYQLDPSAGSALFLQKKLATT
jgi:ribosomal protein S18 acetylase RimI-like enzyme